MPQVCIENFQGLFQLLIIFSVFCIILFFQVLVMNPIDEFAKPEEDFVKKLNFFSSKI